MARQPSAASAATDEEEEIEQDEIIEPTAPADPLSRGSWSFDRAVAQERYDDAVAAAAAFARAEHNLPLTTRKFAERCYDFVTTLMPDLEGLRRVLPRTATPVEGSSILPQEVIDFLAQHDINPPHFRCSNPFHGVISTLYVQGRRETKNLVLDRKEANRIIAEAEENEKDPDSITDEVERERYLKRRKAADATAQSKIAKLVLAAVDTTGVKGLGKDLIAGPKRVSYDTAVIKWQEWQRSDGKDRTISVVRAKTGRKTKAERDAEAAKNEELAEQQRQAAEAERRAAEKEPEATGGEIIEDASYSDLTGGEEAGEAELPPEKETEEGIEIKEPQQPPEPAPTQVKAEGIELTISPPAPPRSGIELTTSPPAPLELSSKTERALAPPLIIDVDGKQVTIRHRKVPEKHLSFSNQSIAEVVPDEGLLRYRKDGGRIVVMEIMDWTE